MILFTESETKSANKFKEPTIFLWSIKISQLSFYNLNIILQYLQSLSNYVLGPEVHSLILSEMERYEANFDI